MQRLNWGLAGIVFLVLLAAGFFWAQEDANDTGARTVTPSASETGAEGASVQQSAPPSDLTRDGAFEFRRVEVDLTRDDAEACLVFTKELDTTGEITYEDYVRVTPDKKIGLRAVGNRLCMQGLSFDDAYSVTLRKGLPAKAGEILAYAETVPVELRDRPGAITMSDGVILPRHGSDGLPITTVNVDAVALKVLRVSDRLLSQLRQGLIDQRVLYGYEANRLEEEQGELVWQGAMDVRANRNETTTTIFPIRRAINEGKPGVYLIVASDAADADSVGDEWDRYYEGDAAQWIIDTDIGLTTFSGDEGLYVFARSLQTARPMRNVEVALVARNNDELARARTDSRGRAKFPAAILRGTGGAEPVAVMAYGSSRDFAFIDLRRPAFDLTDRGVGGRAPATETDAYLFTERGIYRPGQTVEIISMIRDRDANAIADAPITIIIRRPDGMEYRKFVESDLKSGALHIPFTLSATAARGSWSAVAYVDPKGEPIGRVSFDVQDFVPQKLEVALDPRNHILKSGNDVAVDVDARFLYGAPAAGLDGEGEIRVSIDPEPFEGYETYSFGFEGDGFEGEILPLSVSTTDADGKALATGYIEAFSETSKNLIADIKVSVFEPGGRTTVNTVEIPIRAQDISIGIRPGFDGGRLQEDADASFDIIALDENGERIAKSGLLYELVREEIDYHWYELDGRWRYERIVRDRLITSGALDLTADASTELAHTVGWGSHKLSIIDQKSGKGTSFRFYAGWGGSGSTDRPDQVALSSNAEEYKIGDVARFEIKPPMSGKALFVIANEKILDVQQIDVSDQGAVVEIPVSQDWGSGAYAMVTAYRPLESGDPRAPVRAIGLKWIGVDPSDRVFDVSIDAPEVARPRQNAVIPVRVTGAPTGRETFVTLAAVDEGILQLTRFVSPSPEDHFFGKRRLGFDVRDDYGRLIDVSEHAIGDIRAGGDSIGGRGLTAVPTKTVALFSGIVAVDENGVAEIPIRVPDFAGELRLMATAFNGTRIGNAEQAMTVRDRLVGEVILPRFLAPGDTSTATLLLHNVEGPSGAIKASLGAVDAVAIAGGGSIEANLGEGEKTTLRFALSGESIGIGTVNLTVVGPDGEEIKRNWPIEVRPPVTRKFSEEVALIGPGISYQATGALVTPYIPGTETVGITIGGKRNYDAPGLVRWLDRYPYGCLEQTTSRAFPLLMALQLKTPDASKLGENVSQRVQNAIERVIDMQNYNGGFGLWRASNDDVNAWLSAFAMDFLLTAKTQDYVVPTAAVNRGMEWLRTAAGQGHRSDASRAYAFYVLARSGGVNVSDLRYFADTEGGAFKDVIASGLLGAALSQVGDRARSKIVFDRATRLAAGALPGSYDAIQYGTLLRDVAGLTALAAESGEVERLPALLERGIDLQPPIQFTTTQEKAWMVRAAYSLSDMQTPITVNVSGADTASADNGLRLTPTAQELAAGVTIENKGDAPIWRTVTAEGMPAQPSPPSANVVSIERTYLTLSGLPVDLALVQQNDQIVVSIKGMVQDNAYRDMVLLDLLPAGFEIEAVITAEGGKTQYPWLGKLTRTDVAEARDDRFVAAFSVGSAYRTRRGTQNKQPKYHAAYVVRAVTPGSYVVPAAKIEDMYRPQVMAQTGAGRLNVAARN